MAGILLTILIIFGLPIYIGSKIASKIENCEYQHETHPWLRLLARLVDVYLAALLISLLIGIVNPSLSFKDQAGLWNFLLITMYIPIEFMELSISGITPGKALLGISLKQENGEKIKPSQALIRSLRVWWRGLGAGLGPVALGTFIVAKKRLLVQGKTSWDRDGNLVVLHKPVTWMRITIIIVAIVTLQYLVVLANLTNK